MTESVANFNTCGTKDGSCGIWFFGCFIKLSVGENKIIKRYNDGLFVGVGNLWI